MPATFIFQSGEISHEIGVARVTTVDEIRRAFPDDASILVSGTCAETIGTLHRDLLRSAVGDDDGAVVVTTDDTAKRVRRQFEDACEFASRGGLAIVDGTPKDRRSAHPERSVWKTSSPVDFGGAMTALRRGYESLALEHDRIHLLFDTLTTPLLAADSTTILRFAHQVMLEGGTSVGLQVFPVFTNVTNDRDVTRLKHLSEGMVVVRKRGGRRQVQLVGPRETPNEWIDLPEPEDATGTPGFV